MKEKEGRRERRRRGELEKSRRGEAVTEGKVEIEIKFLFYFRLHFLMPKSDHLIYI